MLAQRAASRLSIDVDALDIGRMWGKPVAAVDPTQTHHRAVLIAVSGGVADSGSLDRCVTHALPVRLRQRER